MARPRLRPRPKGAAAEQPGALEAADQVNDRLLEQVDFYRQAHGIGGELRKVKGGYMVGRGDGDELVVYVAGLEVGVLPPMDAHHYLETGFKPGDETDPNPLEELL